MIETRLHPNVFVERLWRSLKYEEVYLYAYDSVREARVGIGRYFDFFNDERPHQALGYQTPASFYDGLVLRCVPNGTRSAIPLRVPWHGWASAGWSWSPAPSEDGGGGCRALDERQPSSWVGRASGMQELAPAVASRGGPGLVACSC